MDITDQGIVVFPRKQQEQGLQLLFLPIPGLFNQVKQQPYPGSLLPMSLLVGLPEEAGLAGKTAPEE
jgi:hypothetical protein